MNEDSTALPGMPGSKSAALSRRPVGTRRDVDLARAIARLGGNVETYRSLFPILRGDAERLVALTTTLLAEGLRVEAQLMMRTLRGVGDALGAFALSRAAAQGETRMGAAAGDDDARLIGQVNLALVRCSLMLERELHGWLSAAPDLRPGEETEGNPARPAAPAEDIDIGCLPLAAIA